MCNGQYGNWNNWNRQNFVDRNGNGMVDNWFEAQRQQGLMAMDGAAGNDGHMNRWEANNLVRSMIGNMVNNPREQMLLKRRFGINVPLGTPANVVAQMVAQKYNTQLSDGGGNNWFAMNNGGWNGWNGGWGC